MKIQTQSFESLVDDMAAAVQGGSSITLNVAVGSITRAIIEASASVALWLQYLVLQVLSMTRLATSTGADVDSWVDDFGLARLPPTLATGNVTFTSFNPAIQGSVIPTGATIRSGDGSTTFAVTGGPYTRAAGTASVTVPAIAVTAGLAGNVAADTVSILGTAIPGIDVVTNALPFTGGSEAESDSALRSRFVTYLNTRSLATAQAVGYAVLSVQQSLSYTIMQGTSANGTPVPGHVTVVVDDGSGSPTSSLLQQVATAVDAVRPLGVSISVVGPNRISVDVIVTVAMTGSSADDQDAVSTAVRQAVADYIATIPVGQVLRISRIFGLCYGASSLITNVSNLSLNGSVNDVGGDVGVVVRLGSIAVSVTS